jgi:hypothetical protein
MHAQGQQLLDASYFPMAPNLNVRHKDALSFSTDDMICLINKFLGSVYINASTQ